jgi:hypothetical protein
VIGTQRADPPFGADVALGMAKTLTVQNWLFGVRGGVVREVGGSVRLNPGGTSGHGRLFGTSRILRGPAGPGLACGALIGPADG